MRQVEAIYQAGYTDYEGLATYRVMPTRNVPIDALDPFLFLNHHGPQVYPPHNTGLPFGPHPHKGFETVTFIVEGDLVHKDSTGFNSNIGAGGIQWMTAGRGIIHSETSSASFMDVGGAVEILQLWINLPSGFKNVPPHYVGLQKHDVPEITEDDGNVIVDLVSGDWKGQSGPVPSLTGVQLCTIRFAAGAKTAAVVPEGNTILFYVIRGDVVVNGETATMHDLVTFSYSGTSVNIEAKKPSMILFGHARPTGEPIAAHGPFVMNSQEEIRQAFVDYQQGKFGVWPH